MNGLCSAHLRSSCIFTVLLAATALTAPSAGYAATDIKVVDGIPSPTACEALGFTTPRYEEMDNLQNMPLPAPTGIVPPQTATTEMLVKPVGPPPMAGGIVARQKLFAIAPAAMENTEKYPDATPNPVKSVADAPVSTFSIDIDTASYSNVRRFLNDGSLPPRDAVRVEELINYFDYGYLKPTSTDTPFSTTIAVTPSPWAPGKEIVHIGLQGYDVARDKQPPLNLVFLIDVSGSMQGEDRLYLAQKALNVLVDELRPDDHVSLAVYAGNAGAVLAPTAGNQKLKIRCAINSLEAGGSTAGGEGLALAYNLGEQNFRKDAVNRVILMTDGDFNVGIDDPEKLEDFVAEKRKTGIYLSAYGFGRGNYNDVMMQTLTQSGNGTAAYVDSLKEARKLFHDDFSGSLFPIADDVKIQVEFNPARVSEYRLIGYETRLLNREDFNNDQVDAGEVGAGTSVTALYEITPVGGKLSSDPLRYQPVKAGGDTKAGDEIAFLKIRYKLPGTGTSTLIDRPITDADRPATLAEAPESTRFALAVAAYGQRLRGDAWLDKGFGWQQVLDLAQGARGADPYGIRAEFVQLVRAAETAKNVNE